MSGKKLLREIEQGINEILEAIMEFIMYLIRELQRKNQSLEQQMLAQIFRNVHREMEKNISEQLRKQMSNLQISTIEWKDRTGSSMKLHLTNDPSAKKEYAFQKLEGDKLQFQPVNHKGGPIYLDIQEIEKVVPALEGRIKAMGTLSKMEEKQAVQSLVDTFQKAKQKEIPLTKAYSEVMSEKVKHEIHQSRRLDLEKAKSFNEHYQKRKVKIEQELTKIKLQKMDLDIKHEVGSVSKKELKVRNQDLDKMSKKLTKEMKELNYGKKKLDKQLAKEIERHCPDLKTKNLKFEDKITLAESVFKYEEGLNKEQLRQSFEKEGNDKGLQLLDQAERRDQTLILDQEETTITMESSFE